MIGSVLFPEVDSGDNIHVVVGGTGSKDTGSLKSSIAILGVVCNWKRISDTCTLFNELKVAYHTVTIS